MNEAIKRILAQHYGGNVAHPTYQKMLARLSTEPSAGRKTMAFIRNQQTKGLLKDLG